MNQNNSSFSSYSSSCLVNFIKINVIIFPQKKKKKKGSQCYNNVHHLAKLFIH